jgi:hypothetical protein
MFDCDVRQWTSISSASIAWRLISRYSSDLDPSTPPLMQLVEFHGRQVR